jgi:hypothetical protein
MKQLTLALLMLTINALAQVVPMATETTLTASVGNDGNVYFTATVTTNGVTATNANGVVVFIDNGVPVSTNIVNQGTAVATVSNYKLPLSSTAIANYNGDDVSYLSSVSIPAYVNLANVTNVVYIATSAGNNWNSTITLPVFPADCQLLAHVYPRKVSDPWDRQGRVWIYDAQQKVVDLVCFDTQQNQYADTVRSVDVTALRPMLQGAVTIYGMIENPQHYSTGFVTDCYLEAIRGGNTNPPNVWVGSVMNGNRNWSSWGAKPSSIAIAIPAGLDRVYLNYNVEGHASGGWLEFNTMENQIFVDGNQVFDVYPWMTPTHINSDGYSRNNWYVGDSSPPYVIDITSYLNGGTSGTHTITFNIITTNTYPTTNANPTGNISGPDGQGYWSVGAFLSGMVSNTITTLASSTNPSVSGDSVLFTASLQSFGIKAVDASGSIVFMDGTTPLSTNSISGGIASFYTSILGSGNHSMTATYMGDNYYAYSTSPALIQTVQQPNISSSPTIIYSSIGNGSISIGWPANCLGWVLQVQTNASNLGITTNWVDIPATAGVTFTNMPILQSSPSVFYRLRSP